MVHNDVTYILTRTTLAKMKPGEKFVITENATAIYEVVGLTPVASGNDHTHAWVKRGDNKSSLLLYTSVYRMDLDINSFFN